MRLNPRYEGPPVLRMEPGGDTSAPLLRQRRRLAETLSTFDADQWAAPTRCQGWSTKDVVSHLVTTNGFWAASMAAGRDGKPTRFLPGFDPAATPALLVDASPPMATSELLDRFVAGNDAIAQAVAGLEGDGWEAVAEAPPGHLALSAVALHALWDSWIHERDICLPLGLQPVEVPDEVAGSLRYVAGLGPALLATIGSTRLGAFAVTATDPEVTFVVEIGPSVLVNDAPGTDGMATVSGGAVDLAEGFSCRRPPPSLSAADQWMVDSLGMAFAGET